MQQPAIQQHLHQRHGAADGDQIGHDEPAGRPEVGEDRDVFPDTLEVVDGEIHPGRVGDGGKVQDGIRGTAERDQQRDRVFKRLLGEDIPRLDAEIDEVDDGGTGIEAVTHLVIGNGVLGRAVGQRHAERLDGAGHAVRGIHAATGPRPGDGSGLHRFELLVRIFTVRVLADGLEYGNDIELLQLALDGGAAGKNRAAVDEDGGPVHAGHGHQAAGHVLVAAADRDEAVHAFAAHHRLDGIRDHFAGNERVFHPFGAHRDPVGNRDCIEDDALATSRVGAPGRLDGQLVDVDVAWRDLAPRRGDADLRFGEIFFFESDGIEHRAARRAVGAINKQAGKGAGGFVHRGRSILPKKGPRQDAVDPGVALSFRTNPKCPQWPNREDAGGEEFEIWDSG